MEDNSSLASEDGWYHRAFEVDLDAIGCLRWDARGRVRACRPSAALKSQYEFSASDPALKGFRRCGHPACCA